MMIVVWGILLYAGYRADSVRLFPFAAMLVVIIPFTAISDYVTISAAANLGEDQSFRWHPAVFAGDVALTLVLWSACYMVGYAIGTKRRRRARDVEPFEDALADHRP